MSNIRFKAIEMALSRPRRIMPEIEGKISDYYGELTFNYDKMREFMSREAFESVRKASETGEKISRLVADQVASAMKAWAIGKGATHFSHWFHPLTGSTAEKHDAFLQLSPNGKALESFNVNELIQQEPDASSFPSGGIRNTFEARGYTAWDPTSPAFIIDQTLCIPTIFVSYTGEALDYKTPLLKASFSLDREALAVCQYFDKNTKRVTATLGWEQEYFLVDSALFNARPDLMLTGRTLFGHSSAKDQQLSDHYFGIIPEKVMDFMREFEYEAHRLGIPVRTRHNEVAPNQFEVAPIFEEVNVAVDHNQLVMYLLEKVGKRHGYNVLLHEKPYSGVNGSGKHNNWSLQNDAGENLLSPGRSAKTNLRFLVFLANILKALDRHSPVLRAYIASAGNDLRLGAHEAPPAIISAFIGTQLTDTIERILKTDKKVFTKAGETNGNNLNIPRIPEILLDNTDRNRTSPFAFTGNKFEFRAVGSSSSCAIPMIALNIIVAEQLRHFRSEVDALMAKGMRKDNALFFIMKNYFKESRRICFEGNSYSDAWIEQAKHRGLPNLPDTPRALKSLLEPASIKMFESHEVLTSREIHARYEMKLENYISKIQIESRVMGDLAINHIIPTAIKYQNELINNVKGLKEVLDGKTYLTLAKNQMDAIREMSDHINEIRDKVIQMTEARRQANTIEDYPAKALAYRDEVFAFFEQIRYHADKLELMVDNEMWPLPKYRELLFIR
ncbi:MAG: glutamine synthetase III [Lentimicrobium sp.]|jgi:glutamine synthetase|nr:glutamine synthetase III [Lentimicrobium sp.]MDD2529253.1 glutamine synthetase III [Lentimicrobiaceae bacterium]MDD4598568.1 glutamine synthetase III [Lentimicrobiaceae bacterium]MDY0024760.1 glutamine synthetase III [Lentimicrobium sp.]